jgi:hypothetical protein
VAEWNPKLLSVERAGAGPLQLGERFGELYRMAGRDRATECEVVELQHPSILVIRHRLAEWSLDRYVLERYRLEQVHGSTRVVQEIDVAQSGISWPMQLLLWILHLTGEPTGTRYLVTLKEIVERERAGKDEKDKR